MSITSAITGPGAAGGGGGGGGGSEARETLANAILALSGTEALVVGGVSEMFTDTAGSSAADTGDGVQRISNLANGIIGTSGAAFVQTVASAANGKARLLGNGDLAVVDDSIRALELATHPFTSAGEWLVGWVFQRVDNIQGNAPLLALGRTPLTNQSYKFSARSNVYGITNDFNPAANLGGTITATPAGWEWLTIARRNTGSTFRILLNGSEVYTGGQTISPAGTDRRPMLFGTDFAAPNLNGIFRAAYFGTDIDSQDDLDSNLGALAAL